MPRGSTFLRLLLIGVLCYILMILRRIHFPVQGKEWKGQGGRKGKNKKKYILFFCTKIVLTGRISFSNSDPSSSIQTSPSGCFFLGLCLETLVTLQLWAGQAHLQPDCVTLQQSESPYPLMIVPQKPTTYYLRVTS